MKQRFQFTPLECTFLVANLLALGACLVLMATKGANGPLVLLSIGAGFSAGGKLGAAYCHTSKPRGSSETPKPADSPGS